MRKNKMHLFMVLVLIAAFVITGCGGKGEPKKAEGPIGESTPKLGGVLNVVLDGNPPTIDPHSSNTTLTFVVGYHIFEGLYTLDEKHDPIPMLAKDMPKISEDGLTYTFELREGLQFHNGQDLTADDVVASLKRWGNMSSSGKTLFANVASVEKIDDLTIEMKLTKPTGITLISLAMPNNGAFIYPAEISEEFADQPLAEYIGTGPFKFQEWKANQYIKLVRYEEYQPVDFVTTGFGGVKTAYVDELNFIPISDEMVRITSVEGGEYDFADFVPVDEYDRLKNSPNIEAIPSAPRAWFGFNFNKRAGVMSDVKIRQAFLAALDMGPIMAAGYGDETFWRLDPGLMLKEQVWWTDAGGEKYNEGNIEKAKKLLAEAGYNGEKIVWMSGPVEYNLSLAAKNQLEKVGFNIDLQSLEWATLVERRSNPDLWEIFSTGLTLRVDPTMSTALNPNFVGWWESPRLIEIMAEMAVETDFDARYALMEEVQELFYEEVPIIKVGDYANLRIHAKDVKGFQSMNEVFFWNVWKD